MGVWYRFLLGVLTTWRVAHLVNAEDGPWQIFVRLRRAAGSGFWGELLDCFYCLSIWVAAPLAYVIGQSWLERLLLVPSLSAAAIVLERLTAEKAPMPHYEEDPEETSDGVLRKESDSGGEAGRGAGQDDDGHDDGGGHDDAA